MLTRFYLSDWPLKHGSFVWFLIIASIFPGSTAYVSMGREEDSNFAIKTIGITAAMPGAAVEEGLTQVTDRIERKLKDLSELDVSRAITNHRGWFRTASAGRGHRPTAIGRASSIVWHAAQSPMRKR